MSDSQARVAFEGSAPILRVGSMEASIRYYVEVLGFRNASWSNESFAYVSRD